MIEVQERIGREGCGLIKRAELWPAAVRLRVWWKNDVRVLWRWKMSPEGWRGLEAGRLGVVLGGASR